MVKIGVDKVAEFELLVMKWANNDPLYLSCVAKLCDPAQEICRTTSDCAQPGRKKRTVHLTTFDDFASEVVYDGSSGIVVYNGPLYPTTITDLTLNKIASSSTIEEN